MDVLATTLDPDGRPVDLLAERWAHIVGDQPARAGHPELRPHRADVVQAIRQPTVRRPGRIPGEEWFYLEGAGPSRYLKVVVAFKAGRGSIIAAFARRSLPSASASRTSTLTASATTPTPTCSTSPPTIRSSPWTSTRRPKATPCASTRRDRSSASRSSTRASSSTRPAGSASPFPRRSPRPISGRRSPKPDVTRTPALLPTRHDHIPRSLNRGRWSG